MHCKWRRVVNPVVVLLCSTSLAFSSTKTAAPCPLLRLAQPRGFGIWRNALSEDLALLVWWFFVLFILLLFVCFVFLFFYLLQGLNFRIYNSSLLRWSLLQDTLAVNFAFEIAGQPSAFMQGHGRSQLSLPSGGMGYLIPTECGDTGEHKNDNYRTKPQQP